jgi:phosphopantothenoylcysteine decarboxylase / phosphopantothenate---cysteine ligase
MDFVGKHILLGITGGIAVYKCADLVRRLREIGADVQVVMTQGAQRFVTPLTFQALSGRSVRTDLWDMQAEHAMGHIELARWADRVIVAPASAGFMARLAHGHADDLLTTLCLATQAPIVIAPAMNWAMWENTATQENVRLLAEHGVRMLGPLLGELAEGEVGMGRMLEPAEIVSALRGENKLPLQGLRVLVTAGPTREPLDPVRYMSNRSSGKMGFALARAAAEAGAETTLVCGPVQLSTPRDVRRVDVETAEQMHAAVMRAIAHNQIFIAAAAVADYTPAQIAKEKIKKRTDSLPMKLVKTPDILADVAARKKSRPFTVGFAAETEKLEAHARAKLKNKRVDMIAANWVGRGRGFDRDDNVLYVYWKAGSAKLGAAHKLVLARQLIQLVVEHYSQRN